MIYRCGNRYASKKDEYKIRNEHAPLRLRSKRPRALSLPLPEPEPEASTLQWLSGRLLRWKSTHVPGRVQIIHDQLQSRLFKLPFELREQIWKYAISENKIVLVHLSKRLAHYRCTWNGTDIHGCCRGNEWRSRGLRRGSFVPRPFDDCDGSKYARYDSTKPGLLSLSKTCRRMYASRPYPQIVQT
jgi:hypothetical protein